MERNYRETLSRLGKPLISGMTVLLEDLLKLKPGMKIIHDPKGDHLPAMTPERQAELEADIRATPSVVVMKGDGEGSAEFKKLFQ